ncbi:MAG: tyrosine-type recombinase/integrase [Synechococcus sp.]
MSQRLPQTSTDVHPIHTEAELVEETALVQVGLTRLALRLEQVAQERDPLAEALQQELGRESRAAYLKDWRTFARWLEATAGHPETSLDLSSPAGVLQAMGAWLQLGDRTARALVQRWMADQSRQGLAAATIGRRLASLKFLARQAALKELADIRLHLLKAPRPERRRDMRGPSGVAALSALVAQAEDRGRCSASRARNRAVALLLLTNALRRGEIGRLSMADWSPAEPLQLAIRGKGRKEREMVSITETTAAAIEAWLALRPRWMSTEPWAPLFCALDQGAQTRAARDLPMALEQAQANLTAMAGPDGKPPAEGSPIWWEEMHLATTPVAFTGKAVYRLVAALGTEGKTLSPHRLRHGAVTTLVADLRMPMEQAQALARHKSVATTCRYFDRSEELQAEATASLGQLLAGV